MAREREQIVKELSTHLFHVSGSAEHVVGTFPTLSRGLLKQLARGISICQLSRELRMGDSLVASRVLIS